MQKETEVVLHTFLPFATYIVDMSINKHFLCLTNFCGSDNGLRSAPIGTELFLEYAFKNKESYIYKLIRNARKVLFKDRCTTSKKYTSEVSMWSSTGTQHCKQAQKVL